MKHRHRWMACRLALPAIAALALAACGLSTPSRLAATSYRAGDPLPLGTAPANSVQPQPPPGSCNARGTGAFSLPDPRCTPGAINPAVSQGNIAATICRAGSTERERPPEWVSEAEKRASLAAYGDPGPIWDYEYDHLVPLELGGAANDPRNLWPEPGPSPNPKDRLEDQLNELVCGGLISLASAQRLIATDWVSAYRRCVGRGGTGP